MSDFDPSEVPAWMKWEVVDATAAAVRKLCMMLGLPDGVADEAALDAMLIAASEVQFSRLDLS